jgi:hypothetical protein
MDRQTSITVEIWEDGNGDLRIVSTKAAPALILYIKRHHKAWPQLKALLDEAVPPTAPAPTH